MILKSEFTMLANTALFLFNKIIFICRYDRIDSLEDLDVKAGEYIKSYMGQTIKNINEQAHVNEKELIDVQRRRYFLTASGVISYIIAFSLGVSFSY